SGRAGGAAAAVDAAGRDVDAAGEAGVVGEETLQQRAVLAAEDLDVRRDARPGAGDDVGGAVAVDVAGGHEHAAGERPVVGEETPDQGAGEAVEDLDVRAAGGAGAGDDVVG